MHIVEVLAWSNDGGKVDHVIDNVLRLLSSNDVVRSEEVRKVLLSVGKRMGVKSLKRLFDRFHQRIERGDIPREYGFYSDITLRNNDPRVVGVREDLEIVLEVFNSPYKFTLMTDDPSLYEYGFNTDNGNEGYVKMENEGDGEWFSSFAIISDDGEEWEQGISGWGDAYKIFATVLDILRHFITVEKPEVLVFSAGDKKNAGENNRRARIYDRMIKKFAPGMGYSLKDKMISPGFHEYTLVKN